MLRNKLIIILFSLTVSTSAHADQNSFGFSESEIKAWGGKADRRYLEAGAEDRWKRMVRGPTRALPSEPTAPRGSAAQLEAWIKKSLQIKPITKGPSGGNWKGNLALLLTTLAAIQLENKTSSNQATSEDPIKILDQFIGKENESFLRYGYWFPENTSTESTQAK